MEKTRFVTFTDDGHIPNNPDLPVILYPASFKEYPEKIEKAFNENGWTNSWQGDVFTYHHYHSNTHEVLGVRSGEATLQLGGENGETLTVKAGDIALLPAGTGHKKLDSSEDFQIIGAYPGGLSPNIKTGKEGERPFVLEEIADVPKPMTDPVHGDEGPVHTKWKL